MTSNKHEVRAGLRLARAVALATAGILIAGTIALAQEPAGVPAMPPTTLEPAPETAPSPGNIPAEAAPTPAKPVAKKPRRHVYHTIRHFETEPANARLPVIKRVWIYASPTTRARPLKRAQPGRFVMVTASTRHYLRVRLKDGRTGYIQQSAVDMVRPTDKLFALTQNTPVRSAPNKWARKIAEVHKGYNVHVIGVALNYMKIRMRSGLEGYISSSALE